MIERVGGQHEHVQPQAVEADRHPLGQAQVELPEPGAFVAVAHLGAQPAGAAAGALLTALLQPGHR